MKKILAILVILTACDSSTPAPLEITNEDYSGRWCSSISSIAKKQIGDGQEVILEGYSIVDIAVSNDENDILTFDIIRPFNAIALFKNTNTDKDDSHLYDLTFPREFSDMYRTICTQKAKHNNALIMNCIRSRAGSSEDRYIFELNRNAQGELYLNYSLCINESQVNNKPAQFTKSKWHKYGNVYCAINPTPHMLCD